MPLPQHFDENEWFIIICIIIFYLIIILLPKRFPLSLIILIMLFGATIARLLDHLLASPKINLYNITDSSKYDLFDFILYFLYAPFAYYFIYIFDKLKLNGFWKTIYIIIFALIGTLFEWLNNIFHVFHYEGWKLSYSFSAYLIMQCLTLIFYYSIRRSYDQSKI